MNQTLISLAIFVASFRIFFISAPKISDASTFSGRRAVYCEYIKMFFFVRVNLFREQCSNHGWGTISADANTLPPRHTFCFQYENKTVDVSWPLFGAAFYYRRKMFFSISLEFTYLTNATIWHLLSKSVDPLLWIKSFLVYYTKSSVSCDMLSITSIYQAMRVKPF